MDKLLAYINSLAAKDQALYAMRCGTTVGYLRKACSKKQLLGVDLVAKLSAESNKAVRPEDVRPDLDWAYLRSALDFGAQAPASIGHVATETAATPAPECLPISAPRRQGGRREHVAVDKRFTNV